MVAPFMGPFMAPGPQPVHTFMRRRPSLVADLLGVFVFLAANGVAAPAHHQVRLDTRLNGLRVAQNFKHRVGYVLTRFQRVVGVAAHFGVVVDQVADHRRQQFAHTLDDLAVDKSDGRRILQLQADTAVELLNLDVEIGVLQQQRLGVVCFVAAVEHRQRATAQQGIEIAAAGIMHPLYLHAAERGQHSGWIKAGINDFVTQCLYSETGKLG